MNQNDSHPDQDTKCYFQIIIIIMKTLKMINLTGALSAVLSANQQ